MSAIPLPQYGPDRLYLYPFFQNRGAYLEARKKDPGLPELKPFDYKASVKRWIDTGAATSPRRLVTYAQALDVDTHGHAIAGPDNKPQLQSPYVLDKIIAASVNIPPDGAFPDSEDLIGEWPCPIRALEPNEELFFPFPGVVAIKNKDLYEKYVQAGFTNEDRELLKAIAKKLEVR